jgi:hypothetical protein
MKILRDEVSKTMKIQVAILQVVTPRHMPQHYDLKWKAILFDRDFDDLDL